MLPRKRQHADQESFQADAQDSHGLGVSPNGEPSYSSQYALSDASSTSAILQRLADLESRLAPLSPYISRRSESFLSPGSSALGGFVPSLEPQRHIGHSETSNGSNAGDQPSQVRSASSAVSPNATTSSGTKLGPWWGVTLEETLDWSGLRQLDLQKPDVIALTDRPLSEVCLLSATTSTLGGSLPLASTRNTSVCLDEVEEMSRLVDKFLRNIHVRNPLIDPAFLRDQVAISAEVGLQWDSAACLLLIVCACGAVASPFNLDKLENYSGASISAHDYLVGRLYFDAARKRLGLLGDEPTQIAVECLFFTGVYYLCAFRPVAAWRSFHSASIMCRHYLQRTKSGISLGRADGSLDSRLYWSCVKSEREVAVELNIHVSNTSLIEYTHSLPSSPPPPIFNDDTIQELSLQATSPASLMSGDRIATTVYEQSWFYYLTDITVRKLEMQMDEYLHRDHEPPKDSSSAVRQSFYQKMIATLSDADERITAHYSTLPAIIAFDMNEQYHSADDLREYLRYRMLGIRQNYHRPALYLVLHCPDDVSSMSPALRKDMVALANRALTFNVYFARHGLTTHRHPGTWLLIRHVTRCALELLAVWKAQSPWLKLESGWTNAVDFCKRALRYWGGESGDALVYADWIEQALRGW